MEPDSSKSQQQPPVFDQNFGQAFEMLLRWRRDVRRFREDALPDGLLDKLLNLADLAPSVGNSQPWRFVLVEDAARREKIAAVFEAENKTAMRSYTGDKAALYARLKLSGLREAPVHLAVFCDTRTDQGHGLGHRTMPETLPYSVVGMIQTLWLAARIHGVGVGWVSIIDPAAVHDTLEVPADWRLVAYLCVGYPQEEHIDPELEREGWQSRTPLSSRIFRR